MVRFRLAFFFQIGFLLEYNIGNLHATTYVPIALCLFVRHTYLFRSVCLPILSYGLSSLPLSQSELHSFPLPITTCFINYSKLKINILLEFVNIFVIFGRFWSGMNT